MIVIFVSTLLTYILQLYKLFDSEGNFATISFIASSCLSFTGKWDKFYHQFLFVAVR